MVPYSRRRTARRTAAPIAGSASVRRGTSTWAESVPGRRSFANANARSTKSSGSSLGSEDPLDFVERALAFANDRLPGTLSAQVLVPRRTLADPAIGAAVRRAVRRLEYGTIGVNCFAGYGFAFGTLPWGGFPGAPLQDARSGRGFVHNTLMLEGVEKSVVWSHGTEPIKPVYFPTHRTLHRLGPRLAALEGRRAWRALPGVVWAG